MRGKQAHSSVAKEAVHFNTNSTLTTPRITNSTLSYSTLFTGTGSQIVSSGLYSRVCSPIGSTSRMAKMIWMDLQVHWARLYNGHSGQLEQLQSVHS